ncbi:hypothetical protein TSTA_057680 [Talaromyces stipitatus ATCC 10500]|uniref:Uncharacterized protein n=1 Tax=Talaromyces stipitatus (strain ATCC 10500 / CBS 375.48 / QM 6759 / NRRL 1006) TaxID=441959 RepID=B8MRU5_TALSN|nr:uncharacterized protein TSTA_057680 [Talaromyces stipitatus ATCC 10500]EED13279.1 hypothetical protein TSTA_057680 [Talaromyces stipitatus ATCC 10500]
MFRWTPGLWFSSNVRVHNSSPSIAQPLTLLFQVLKMRFTLPTIAFLTIVTGALAGSGEGNNHQQYSKHVSSMAHSTTLSHETVTTPIPTHSSKAVTPSKTSAVPSKSSFAVNPSKSAGGGSNSGHGGSGSGSGSDSGSESGSGGEEGGSETAPTYVPGNPAARIDAQEATFLGAALGALGAFVALV